ncbi:hypothetical protein EV130_11536 [Rhizobium azibense]|uniref:Uncharacterized protein n=1 Tax=Rhizobium azibense TaxID=1136135 RepID=A0A4R3QAD5_9HYPH|nr:hypothetical protein [Rhizobium azibense]TCU17839.1 hypothetical protein EV130_11536 [Rhizobium azibense]
MNLAKAVTAGILFQLSVCSYSEALASEPLEDFPFVVTCEYKGLHHAYYLSKLGPDGVATYITPDRLAGTISIDGQAKARGEGQVGSCLGKTLKELRASGQAYDIKR